MEDTSPFEPPVLTEAQEAALRAAPAYRRSSDPTSNRPVVRRRRPSDSSLDEDSDGTVDLPDRFDSQGRPLDGSWQSRQPPRMRRGSFMHRPRHPGDWDVRGAWAVGGTDDDVVNKLVGDMEGLLSGRKHWTDVIQDVVQEVLPVGRLNDVERDNYDDDDNDRRRRRRRKRRTE